MAMIVLDSNAGPDRSGVIECDDARVIVSMRDGAGTVLQAGYDDLDTLTEVVILWTEAHAKLTKALIAKHGQERTVLSVQAGDRIVVPDDADSTGPIRGQLVEVSAVYVHSTAVLFQVDGGDGVAASVTLAKGGTVVVVRQPAVAAVADEMRSARIDEGALGQLQRDLVR